MNHGLSLQYTLHVSIVVHVAFFSGIIFSRWVKATLTSNPQIESSLLWAYIFNIVSYWRYVIFLVNLPANWPSYSIWGRHLHSASPSSQSRVWRFKPLGSKLAAPKAPRRVALPLNWGLLMECCGENQNLVYDMVTKVNAHEVTWQLLMKLVLFMFWKILVRHTYCTCI